ncbi:amelotin [Echinops telfairi]|uniref:Amelotin n=1 Tax=Echinops telfairi TaxID=9371 RepID=A0ABM0IMF2_ECHTE|nr:amelotin [Echinops telfairi]
MKTIILLFCLLGSTQSLPVFPSLSLIPLTQMLALGSDLQMLNTATGVGPGTQTLPVNLGGVTVQQQLQPQMLPIFVAQLGTQGAILSSEELPVAPQVYTGLLIHPWFPGAFLPTSQAGSTPEGQDGALPAGQAAAHPAIQGTPEGHLPTPSGTDYLSGVTAPAGLQRDMHTTEEATTDGLGSEPRQRIDDDVLFHSRILEEPHIFLT